jgi:hypothetical protein
LFIESIINQRGVRRVVGSKHKGGNTPSTGQDSASDNESPVSPPVAKKSFDNEKEPKRSFMEEFQMQMTIFEKEYGDRIMRPELFK